jgi:hypothetical protein
MISGNFIRKIINFILLVIGAVIATLLYTAIVGLLLKAAL